MERTHYKKLITEMDVEAIYDLLREGYDYGDTLTGTSKDIYDFLRDRYEPPKAVYLYNKICLPK